MNFKCSPWVFVNTGISIKYCRYVSVLYNLVKLAVESTYSIVCKIGNVVDVILEDHGGTTCNSDVANQEYFSPFLAHEYMDKFIQEVM